MKGSRSMSVVLPASRMQQPISERLNDKHPIGTSESTLTISMEVAARSWLRARLRARTVRS
jgi:hypothetical protein